MKTLSSLIFFVVIVLTGCGGIVAQGTPTPTPTVSTPTPLPTPAPTPEGAGVITFGKKVDPATLLIATPITTFSRTTKAIAWSAYLSQEPNTLILTWMLIKKSSSGVESLLHKWTSDVTNATYTLWANTEDFMYWADYKAGTYVLRALMDDGTVLAEGSFKAK